MFNYIKNSLSYRLPWVFEKLSDVRSTKTLSKLASGHFVIMMTGKAYKKLFRNSILSISRNWDTLPTLIVASDGSMTELEIRRTISFWTGELIVQSWIDSASYHQKLNRPALVRYAEVNPFGKKMAIILHHAELHPSTWIDNDILFFKDFTPFFPVNQAGIQCGGSEDNQQAFHEHILASLKTDKETLGSFNAGLLYVSGENIYEKYNLETLLSDIHPNYDFLTEQTLFAFIANQSLGILWSRNVIENFHTDNQKIKPAYHKDLIGRHYTSTVRHLFWRDAFFLKT